MTTKAMMIHRDYLRLYTCGGKSISNSHVALHDKFERMALTIIDFVDRKFLCEDIGLNFVVGAILGLSGGPAPLYVESLHKIGDFGQDSSSQQSKAKLRDTCLRVFHQEFLSISGYRLPYQTKIIRAKFSKENQRHAILESSSYEGHRVRQFVECDESNLDKACSWMVPSELHFTATYISDLPRKVSTE